MISMQAQDQSKIDSMLNALKTATADTNKVILLNALSTQHSLKADYENSKKYADEALQLAKKLNDRYGEAKAYLFIGDAYSRQGNYAEALNNISASIKINEEIGIKKGVAKGYLTIGTVYMYQGNYPEALKSYFNALKIEQEIGRKQSIGDVYNNIGLVFDRQGNYLEALNNHFASLKLKEEIGDKIGVANSYGNIALIYLRQGNYPEALKYNYVSLKIFEEIENKVGISNCYINIARIYSLQGNHAEALNNLSAALKIKEEIGDKQGISSCYSSTGLTYSELGNYPEALKNYSAALKISEDLGDKSNIAYSHQGIGNIYQKQGDYTKALKNYFDALKMAEEIGDRSLIAFCYSAIGTVYREKEQYTLAIDYLNKGLDLGKIIGLKDLTKITYENLASVYEKLNDFKNAFKFQKLYFQMNDSLFNEAKSKQLTEMKTKYESENKDQEITLLTKDKEIQNIAIKKQTLLKNSFMGGFGLTLLLFFLIYNNYRTSQKLKLETIRNNIAADLHDDIGSTLNSISLFSEVAKQEAGKPIPALDQIGVSARKIIDAMGDIVWTINPENDTFENVIARMRSLSYLLLKAKAIEFTFKVDENLNRLSLPMPVRKNFYLLFKEALNNMVKYSNATHASFNLSLDNKIIKLNISDNGVGFDTASASGAGNGIKNMKRRAAEIGAQLVIESAEGEGTNIELSLKS